MSPINHPWLDGVHGRVGPVVDYLAAALYRAHLQEADVQPLEAAHNLAYAHAVLAQELDTGVAQVVVGQAGDEIHRHAEVSQRHDYVGFAPAVDVKGACLSEAQKPLDDRRTIISPKATNFLAIV
jgi:hypothetical protein